MGCGRCRCVFCDIWVDRVKIPHNHCSRCRVCVARVSSGHVLPNGTLGGDPGQAIGDRGAQLREPEEVRVRGRALLRRHDVAAQRLVQDEVRRCAHCGSAGHVGSQRRVLRSVSEGPRCQSEAGLSLWVFRAPVNCGLIVSRKGYPRSPSATSDQACVVARWIMGMSLWHTWGLPTDGGNRAETLEPIWLLASLLCLMRRTSMATTKQSRCLRSIHWVPSGLLNPYKPYRSSFVRGDAQVIFRRAPSTYAKNGTRRAIRATERSVRGVPLSEPYCAVRGKHMGCRCRSMFSHHAGTICKLRRAEDGETVDCVGLSAVISINFQLGFVHYVTVLYYTVFELPRHIVHGLSSSPSS